MARLRIRPVIGGWVGEHDRWRVTASLIHIRKWLRVHYLLVRMAEDDWMLHIQESCGHVERMSERAVVALIIYSYKYINYISDPRA